MELAPGGDLRRLRGAGYLAIVRCMLEIAQADRASAPSAA